jgi:Zn-dependent protease with chaperone function
MDFFQRQDQARRSTRSLVLYFGAGVTMLILSVYLVVWFIFVGVSSNRRHHASGDYETPHPSQTSLWKPELFLGVSTVTLAIIGFGSLFKTIELSRGGSAVATMLNGRLVNPHTDDPDERKLLNIVEEMAIASGVPVPQVYLLPAEQGINAFAAGHATSDAVIGVTDGAIRLLSRDELQGVIAHEFSHILNGDMRLNLRLMGVIFGLVCLAVIGRILIETTGREKNPLPLLGLALLILGWTGVLFGRMIQAAVSRQREYLADASAIQFTRNPDGLAGALKKIGGLRDGSRLKAAHASEASHMFFGNGMRQSFFLHVMDTHPPLTERIRAIDPAFDGLFPLVGFDDVTAGPPPIPAAQRLPILFPIPGVPKGQGALAGLVAPAIAVQSVMPALGAPTTAHLRYAADLRDSFPDGLRSAARDPLGACTIIYALLLSDDEPVRLKQLNELAAVTSDAVSKETLHTLPLVEPVATRAKLPLVDLALPGLRGMSPRQFEQFRSAVQKLVESDSEIDLFEYVIQKVVLRHLEPHFSQARKPVVQYYTVKPLVADCAVLLSALAHIGHEQPDRVAFAFQQGAQPLARVAQGPLGLLAADQSDLGQVDAALNRLSQAVPQIKKNVLTACAQTVGADGVIQETEAELLRAIADTLDCPMPPLIQEAMESRPKT